MADYTAPFHLPDFTDEAFEKKKAEYVAKNGYTITFPKLTDIIKFPIYKSMTEEEVGLYKARKYEDIGEKRLTEIYAMKMDKRQKFERMLASPTPEIVGAWASIAQALDDAQDALLTIAVAGRIAAKFLPRFLARFAMGPVGWIWLIGEVLNALMAPWACIIRPMRCKRRIHDRLRRRAKGMRAQMKHFASRPGVIPSFSEGIQALQVTKDVWGWGLSLGPIIGLATDLVSGAVRYARGEDVRFKEAPGIVETYVKAGEEAKKRVRWKSRYKSRKSQDYCAKAAKSMSVVYGFKRRTDPLTETLLYIAAECAMIGAEPQMKEWNPYIQVDGLEHIEVEAPQLTDILWQEIFEEKGMDPDDFVAWPSLGKRWATYEEISASVAPIAAASFDYFTQTIQDQRYLAVMEESAIEAGLRAIALLEGEDSIRIQYHASLATAEMLLNHGYAFPLEITQEQATAFMDWTVAHEDVGTSPTLREALAYAKNNLAFEFRTGP
ncbi:hypothetical protein ES702_05945 [subsurface metagenome]